MLCDEFQDTNTVQYLLVKHFARSSGAVTVVGDPDQVRRRAVLGCRCLCVQLARADPQQSIYGWRSAEIGNLLLMQAGSSHCHMFALTLADFKPTEQIFLEENYRSTGRILGASLAVVKQGPSSRLEPS